MAATPSCDTICDLHKRTRGQVPHTLRNLYFLQHTSPTARLWLKLPTLPLHELFKREALDIKVLADVGYLHAMLFEFFRGHDRAALNGCLCDNEGVSNLAALEDFLLLDVLLEVRDGVDFPDESAFCGCRRGKEML